MAFGQKQVAVAIPQPGTSNLPIPLKVRVSGGFLGLFPKYTYLPPFRPVVFSVAETHAAAVSALSAQLTALIASLGTQIGNPNLPGSLIANLSEINSNLSRIADQKQALASSLQNLNTAIGTRTAAINQETLILASKSGNQILYNNFHRAYSGENPELPELKEQVKQSVKEAIQLNDAARTSGMVNGFITSTVKSTQTWIAGTEVYKTVGVYLNKVKDSILAIVPPSLKSTASQIKTGKVPQ